MSATALLTPAAAATYLGLSRRDLIARARRGEIGCVHDRGRSVTCRRQAPGRAPEEFRYQRETFRFRPVDLDAWIVAHYQPAKGAPPLPPPVARGPKPWEQIPARDRHFS